MAAPERVIAIDWSGSLSGEREAIVLAEAGPRGLVRVESGRSREQVAQLLMDEHARGEPVVIGLDFAFSFPAWYVQSRGWLIAPDVWCAMAAGEAEEILTSGRSPEPFWGRAGSRRPSERELFRRTEQGTGGKSVFQIGGAGAVGTGSLRGMAVLHQLHEAGLAIWPFMAPGPAATVVEIYPRLLSGPVIKSNAEERRTYLRRFSEGQLNGHREAAAASEDAFDAAVSALVMWEHRDRLSRLCRGSDSAIRLEGAIWHPSSVDGSEAATGAA